MNFFSNLTIVFQLVFIGCLLFLGIRTKSVGVILIGITLLIGRIFNWAVNKFYFPFLLNRPQTSEMRSIEILHIVSHVSSWLILAFCIFGVFIIYNEWKQGKFQNQRSINMDQLTESSKH